VIVPNAPIWLRALCAVSLALAAPAYADEGGVSFWLPGQFGSLAAVPTTPGWALGSSYYHASVGSSGDKSFSIGGKLAAGVNGTANMLFLVPTYTFAEPVLGGQAGVSLAWAFGRTSTTADVAITGPLERSISASETDSVFGGSDLYPLGTLKWNDGKNNYMLFAMAGIPTGAYRLGRLANVSVNHGSIDGGGAYTYLDQEKGHELSITAGVTYNFENTDTHYRNGVDSHIDWGLAQFLSENSLIGLVGYYYYQLTGDSGSGATLGDFKARVGGIGPQAGYFFPFAGQKAYVNLKAYWEFDAVHRADGWNFWVTLGIPLGSPPK
jgi:hypothetical protein